MTLNGIEQSVKILYIAFPIIICYGSSFLPGSPLQPIKRSIGIEYTPLCVNDIRGLIAFPTPLF